MDELERQRELLERTLDEFNRQGALTADSLEEVNKSTSAYNKTVKQAEDALQRFSKSGMGKVTKATGDLASGFVRGAQAARQNRESFESLNPVIEGAAAALSAIPIVGDALGKTFATVGTFVTSELQKSVEAFQTLGDVGAIGAGGVTGLRKSAEQAGLSFDQLARITKDNSQTLAFAFGSTAKGLENIAGLTSAAEPFRRELIALGFGITEQTEVFADFINISRRLGRAQSTDYQVLAAGAAEYAQRLDRLSRLTGASTDALQSEIDAQQTNIRFRRALRDLPDTAQDAISNVGIVISKVGNDPALTQGFQDMVAGFGTEASRNFAIATGGVGPAVVEQLKAGVITEQQALQRIQQSLGQTFDTLPAQVLGLGTPFDATAQGMANFADAADFSAERIREIAQAQRDAKTATDTATGAMVNAQLSLQKFATEADTFVNNQIFPRATEVISTLTDSLSSLTGGINQLADGLPSARAAGGPVTSGQPYLVGEEGPEIFSPGASGQITNADITSKLAAIAQGNKLPYDENDPLRFSNAGGIPFGSSPMVEGLLQTFMPGIGNVSQYTTGGITKTIIETLNGAIEEYTKVAIGGVTQEIYSAAGQTYQRMTARIGDVEAQTNFMLSGPRSSYDSAMAGVRPQDLTVYKDNIYDKDTYDRAMAKSARSNSDVVSGMNDVTDKISSQELVKIFSAMTAEMSKIAANTKAGADTSKQLLRSTAG